MPFGHPDPPSSKKKNQYKLLENKNKTNPKLRDGKTKPGQKLIKLQQKYDESMKDSFDSLNRKTRLTSPS